MAKAVNCSEVLIALQRGTGTPLHIQLERGLRLAIQTGRITPGSLLPSSRTLSAELGVSRGLVVEVYEQLIAEGYLCSRRASSTYVANRPIHDAVFDSKSEDSDTPRYDFRPGRPDHSLFPRRAWLSAVRRALASAPNAALDYPDPRGAPTARNTLGSYLNRGLPQRVPNGFCCVQDLRRVCAWCVKR